MKMYRLLNRLKNYKGTLIPPMRSIRRGHYLSGIILVALAVYLATFCLQHNPSTWFDEGIYIQIANNLVEQGKMAIQVAPNTFEPLTLISVGYPVYYTAAAYYKIFGIGFLQARYAAVFYLLLFTAAFFFLNKHLYGKKSAFFSTLLLITFASLYGNGRNLLGEIPGLFFMTVGLLGYFHWEKKDFKKYIPAIISGLGFGLAAATKPAFLVLGGGILLALFLARKSLKNNLKKLGIFILSGTIPLLWWFYTQFGSLQVIQKILGHYANPYGEENIRGLIWPNLLRLFTESTPLHFMLLALTLIIAAFARHNLKKKAIGVEIIIYSFIVLTFLSYLRTPGWYRYFFLAHIFLIFTFYPSIVYITTRLFTKKFAKYITIFITLILIAVQGIHLAKTGMSCYEGKTARANNFMQEWIQQDKFILLINSPELVARLPHFNYAQILEITERITYGAENTKKLKENNYDQVIIKSVDIEQYSEFLQCYELNHQENIYQFYIKKNTCQM